MAWRSLIVSFHCNIGTFVYPFSLMDTYEPKTIKCLNKMETAVLPVERSCFDNILIMSIPGTYFLLRNLQNQTVRNKNFHCLFLDLKY